MKKINALSILLTGKCNLDCNFCFLHKNKAATNLHEIVKNAWENNTYLDIIEKTLIKLGTQPSDITHITLWGGEPLLELDYFNKKIDKLFNLFPNIKEFWTSTNFNININKFTETLILLEQNTNHPIEFNLQISMDSIFNKFGHNLPLELYKKNIKELLDVLNLTKFNYLKLTINFRSTVDEKIFLEKFKDVNTIKEYLSQVASLNDYVDSLITNKNINFLNCYAPAPSYPTHMTSQEGIELSYITRLYDNIKTEFNLPNSYHAYENFGHVGRDITSFKNNYECSNLASNITILPDGSIPHCINGYILVFPEYEQALIENDDKSGQYELQMERPYTFNPLKMSNEELKKHLYFIRNGVKNNISTYRYIALAMCDELLASNQISNIYKNKELLLKHIDLTESILGCMFYNLHTSQIPYTNSPSFFRKYLNGVMEYLEQQETKKIKERLGL